jgi:hypothetical protein
MGPFQTHQAEVKAIRKNDGKGNEQGVKRTRTRTNMSCGMSN